jgi:hypothetical protein
VLNARALTAALVVGQGQVFAGVMNDTQDPPASFIVSVALATGQVTWFPLGQAIPNQIVAMPGALFYLHGKVLTETDGWRFEYGDVARLDLASGKVAIVDHALVAGTITILSVVGNESGVFWSMLTDPNGASVIKRWDDATRLTQFMFSWDRPMSLLIDRDHFYWSELDTGQHTIIQSMPIPSGPIRRVFRWPQVAPDSPSLAAIDDESLYYVASGSAPPGVVAMLKTAGDDHMVLNGAQPIVFGSKTIDRTHLYWVDQTDQATILRAPKQVNAPFETFGTTAGDTITDLVVDDCNVYWTAGNRLFARAK